MRTRTLISVTEVRRDVARVMEQARRSPAPLFITQYGYITAVLLAPQQYEDLRAAARRSHQRVQSLLNGLCTQETAYLMAGQEPEE